MVAFVYRSLYYAKWANDKFHRSLTFFGRLARASCVRACVCIFYVVPLLLTWYESSYRVLNFKNWPPDITDFVLK